MKKLLISLIFVLLAVSAYANTKITQMPSGGTTQANDLIPAVRAGVNVKTNFPNTGAAPAGPLGAFQTFATSTTLAGLLPPAALTAISSGVFVDPRAAQFGSNTCTGYYQISASALVNGGSGYAVNDTFTVAAGFYGANVATGHVTSVAGGAVTSYVIDTGGGGYNSKTGQTLATTATSGSGTGLTISITTVAQSGNDDTAAFAAAGIYAASVGGVLLVPNACWVSNLILPSGLTMMGMGWGVNYGFSESQAGASLPNLFTISTPNYVINMNGAFDQAFVGFQVNAFAANVGAPHVCIGGSQDTGAFNGSREWFYKMSTKGCEIGIGQVSGASGHLLVAVEDSDLGGTGFSGAQAGASGNFSDSWFYKNTFAGNGGSTGIICGGSCFGGFRIVGNRFEFQKMGIDLTSADGLTLTGNQFDHHVECQIRVTNGAGSGVYSDNQFLAGGLGGSLQVTGAVTDGGLIRLTVTGDVGSISGGSVTSDLITGDTAFVQNVGGVPNATGTFLITVIDGTHIDLQGSTFGGAYTSGGTASIKGKDSSICLQNPLSSAGFGSDNSFVNNSWPYNGTHTHYALEVTTTGSYQDHLTMMGGFAEMPPFPFPGLQLGLVHWVNGTAPHFIQYGVQGQPGFITDPSATGFSINAVGALGLLTSSPTVGTIFDALSATTTLTSSWGLPGGTTTNRPTTGVAGMERYNSTLLGVEAFFNGTWNEYGFGNAGGTTQNGVGALSALTTGTSNTVFGLNAGNKLTTGGSNVVIGPNVGSTNLTIGSNNILIGTTSGLDATTSSTSNSINIGGVYGGNNSTQHLAFKGALAAITSGATDCGTSPAIAGNDNDGVVTAGTSPSGTCTVVYGVAHTQAPNCFCNNYTSASRGCSVLTQTTTSMALSATTSPFTAADSLGYFCPGHSP